MAFFNFNLGTEYNNAQIDTLKRKFQKHRDVGTLEAERKIRTYCGYALAAYAYPDHLFDPRFSMRDVVRYHPAGKVLEQMMDYLKDDLGYKLNFSRKNHVWKFTSNRNSYWEVKQGEITNEPPECVGLMNLITCEANKKLMDD